MSEILRRMVTATMLPITLCSPVFARDAIVNTSSGVENRDLNAEALPAFASGILPNGVRYIIDRVPDASVGIMLVMGAGSHDEQPDQSNAAHVIEHILVAALEDDGRVFTQMQKAGDIRTLGASTGHKRTHYAIEVQSSYLGGPAPLLQVVREWLSAPVTDSAVMRERSSVSEEARGTEASGALSFLEMQEKAFGGGSNSVARRALARLSALSPEAVRAFYEKWYRPDLATLIVTGDVDVPIWKQAIANEIAKIPAAKSANPRLLGQRLPERYVEPDFGRRNSVFTVDRENDPRLLVRLISKAKLLPADSVRAHERQVLFSNLTELLLYRIAKSRKFPPMFPIVRGGEATDVQVSSIFAAASIDPPSSFDADVTLVRQATQSLTSQLAQIRRFGATGDEFESAKRQLRTQISGKSEGTENRLLRYADIAHLTSTEPLPDSAERIRILENITFNEMNAYLKTAINFDRDFDVAVMGPTKRTSGNRLCTAISEGVRAGLTQPISVPRSGVFIRRIAEPSPVRQELAIDRIDVDTAAVRLPNGHAVILHRVAPSDTLGDDVVLMGGRTSNSDILQSSAVGLYTLQSGFVARPLNLDPDAFSDFYDREGVHSAIELRHDRSILSLSGPNGSLDVLLQAARIALNTERERAEISPTGAIFAISDHADVIDRNVGTKPDQTMVNRTVDIAVRRFSPTIVVVAGNFDPVEAASLSFRYLSDVPGWENMSPSPNATHPTEMRMSSDTIVKLPGGEGRGSPTVRHYSRSFENVPSTKAAIAVVVQLLNDAFFAELRSSGGYDASVRSTVWPGSSDGRAIIDVTFAYSIDKARADIFEQLTDAVVASAASGNLDRKRFSVAKRRAIANALLNGKGAREFSRTTVERMLDTGNLQIALESDAHHLNNVSYEDVQRTAIQLFADIGATSGKH